jgi:diguanylate cyclase (GGDEF)-like protein
MKVLIADDQPMTRYLLEESLTKWGYEVVVCETGDAAYRILSKEDSPDIAILDWMMPGMRGPEICEKIRFNTDTSRLYTFIIMLTSKAEKEDIVAGMLSGADDYIVKPVDLNELRVRLRAGGRIIELQRELIEAREQLRVQATHDHLTGMLNRGAVDEILKRELARAERDEVPLGVIMLDLDHFKVINDTYGHATGDTVLRGVADILNQTLRKYDCAGRYGGEEFLVIVPKGTEGQSVTMAERIREGIEKAHFKNGEETFKVTASLGVASFGGTQPFLPLPDCVNQADKALYIAKSDGRNCVRSC